MDKRKTAPLNSRYLNDRIEQLDLRKWWIAEQLNIAPKTLRRWASGEIKNVSRDHLKSLSQLLQCSESELILTDPSAGYADSAEKHHAAQDVLRDDHLLSDLGKFGGW